MIVALGEDRLGFIGGSMAAELKILSESYNYGVFFLSLKGNDDLC